MRRARYRDDFSGITRLGWIAQPTDDSAYQSFYADGGLVFVVNVYAEVRFLG